MVACSSNQPPENSSTTTTATTTTTIPPRATGIITFSYTDYYRVYCCRYYRVLGFYFCPGVPSLPLPLLFLSQASSSCSCVTVGGFFKRTAFGKNTYWFELNQRRVMICTITKIMICVTHLQGQASQSGNNTPTSNVAGRSSTNACDLCDSDDDVRVARQH